MKLLDGFSLTQTPPGEEPDRRRFLRRASGIGAAFVSAIAVTWADSPAASAKKCDGNVGCCILANPNGPWCGGHPGTGKFKCPEGYYKRYWTCCCEDCCFDCYECGAKSSCFEGPWACSNFTATCHHG